MRRRCNTLPTSPNRWLRLTLPVVLCALLMVGCGGVQGVVTPTMTTPAFSPEARLGAKAFFETGLSASGQQSCASCHAPQTGHAAPNALAVQPGGPDMKAQGLRNSPTLRYLARNGAFHFDKEGTPTGGFFWDGRANSLREQAGMPLLNEREMANPDRAAVVAKIAQTPWAQEFETVFGTGILQNTDLAFEKLSLALERFQLEEVSFNSYSSKYDEFLRGRTPLSAPEARGLALFNDPKKGNCAACHTSTKNAQGQHPLFTDFTYDALGVPRHQEIPDNANPAYYDLGLCGRDDLKDRTDLCGAFKVPTLRNVALRQAYFHNGRFKTLKDVIRFYVQRDTHPPLWYPRTPSGRVNKFDDLPPQYHGTVNTTEVPYQLQEGETPLLNEGEIDDVAAFLNTLTDDWQPDASTPASASVTPSVRR